MNEAGLEVDEDNAYDDNMACTSPQVGKISRFLMIIFIKPRVRSVTRPGRCGPYRRAVRPHSLYILMNKTLIELLKIKSDLPLFLMLK